MNGIPRSREELNVLPRRPRREIGAAVPATTKRDSRSNTRAIRSASASGVIARIKKRFCFDVAPAINSMCDFRSESDLLNSATIALLALPLSGDWVTLTFNIAACSPRIALCRAAGCARTGRIVPLACGCKSIIAASRGTRPSRRGRSWRLPRLLSRSRRSYPSKARRA